MNDPYNVDVDTMLLTGTQGYSGFGEDLDGQLYVVNQQNGQVKKIYDPCPMEDPEITASGDLLTATEGESYQCVLERRGHQRCELHELAGRHFGELSGPRQLRFPVQPVLGHTGVRGFWPERGWGRPHRRVPSARRRIR
jgi:hypothetical protein